VLQGLQRCRNGAGMVGCTPIEPGRHGDLIKLISAP
jgi:hypothetical protein